MSKSVILPSISRLYEILVERLDTLIFELDHPPQDFAGTKISNDQKNVLRRVYIVMKEKLIKYDTQVRRKPMFLVAIILDPRFKFGHILFGDHKFVIETLLKFLESLHIIEVTIITPNVDLMPSLSQAFKSNDAIHRATTKYEHNIR